MFSWNSTVLVFLFIIRTSHLLPIDDSNNDKSLYQGDIMLTPEEQVRLTEDNKDNKRTKRQLKSYARWPDGIVHYEFDRTGMTEFAEEFTVRKAFKDISDRSCITFIEKNATNRIRIEFTTGCASYVGMIGGVQRIRMGPGCPLSGSKVHELLHALGTHHTMSRFDRDQYLNVDPEVISPTDPNYYLRDPTNSYNVIPYEYSSVMQYTASDAAYPKHPEFANSMGIRYITFYDIKAINTHYNCLCPIDLDCKNGGYTNPANCSECLCPSGFGGILCDTAPREFSKKLKADLEWKEHSVKFGFNGLYDHWFYKKTFLFIEAPVNKTIQVQATHMSSFYCDNRCAWSGFEIKYMGDPRYTNPLFCCKDTQNWNQTFTTKLNPTVVIIHTRYKRLELRIKYRYINASLNDLPRTNNTFDSFEYPA